MPRGLAVGQGDPLPDTMAPRKRGAALLAGRLMTTARRGILPLRACRDIPVPPVSRSGAEWRNGHWDKGGEGAWVCWKAVELADEWK